jgi:riboflavin transporter FmnP
MSYNDTYNHQNKFFSTYNIVIIALLSALSFVLYRFLRLPAFPFFPSFLQVNFSSIVILLATFMLGLRGGLVVVAVRGLLELPFGGENAYIGALADVIMGVAIVVPTWAIYAKYPSRMGAILAMVAATIVGTIVAILVNRVMLIPLYVEVFFGGEWEALLGWVRPLYPEITVDNFYSIYLWAAVLPFNLMWLVPTCIITFCLYRPLEDLLKYVQNRQHIVDKSTIYQDPI